MSAGDPATGRVTVKAAGRTYTAKLDDNGKAVIRLQAFENTGQKTVKRQLRGRQPDQRCHPEG